MPIAVGGSSPSRLPSYPQALSVSVTDFGAVADNFTDASPAFEAAYAALVAKLNNTQFGNFYGQRGFVYFPGGNRPYALSRPMKVEDPNIWIVGDGPSSRIEQRGLGPCAIFGLRTREQTPSGAICQLDATYRPDLFGKLDTTVATGPNQRWGLRTNRDASVIFQGVPFSHGGPEGTTGALDHWGSATALTLECCIESGDGGIFPAGYVGGVLLLGAGSNLVFSLQKGGGANQFDFQFRTVDSPGQSNSISLSAGGASGPLRLAFQLDLVNRRATGYVNGVQVTVGTGGPFFSGSGATSLVRNEFCGLQIGLASSESDLRAPVASEGTQFIHDLRVYGLAISRRLRYKDRGNGLAQQRLDNGTINDNYRYLGGDNSDTDLVAFLTLLDNPNNALTGRNVTAMSRFFGGSHLGYFLQTSMFTLLGGIIGNGLSDLRLVNSFPNTPTVVVGGIIDLTVQRCIIEGGTQAVGTLNLLANYTVHITDCELSASDASYYGAWSAMIGRNLKLRNAGRSTIRSWASDVDIQDAVVAFANPQTESVVKVHAGLYGGLHKYRDLFIDFEGEGCKIAPFYIEQFPGFIIAPATSMEIKNVYAGTTGATPLISVKTRADYANDGINFVYLDVNNVQTVGADYTSVVEVDGPNVTGEIAGIFPPNGPQFRHREVNGKGSALVVRSTTYKAPPRVHHWYAGAHALETRNGVDGQFTEWRCVKTGTYGTATPPTWAGVAPAINTPSSLAGYVLNHAYINANLS